METGLSARTVRRDAAEHIGWAAACTKTILEQTEDKVKACRLVAKVWRNAAQNIKDEC